MTDKEFKRLSRSQLIEIIYQLQIQIDELNREKRSLEAALSDKRLRIENAGNLADAVLEINDCFRNAQNAAEQYLSEIKAIREEAAEECERIVAQARAEAEAIRAEAKKLPADYDAVVEAILNEYGQSHSDNG